ncbi:SCO family protein [Actibacterium sp. XHP0104]|uniref:SCO family protein n=1 Tax=Actibacterium sp. XHP0104 TaxID=2984335 RepID=UPI0021E8B122|nr:SCO family protein [Actibacterium sp. XHP0104]MCV2881693.1 SCO family protein [Actibacterium sp. XHP0104]
MRITFALAGLVLTATAALAAWKLAPPGKTGITSGFSSAFEASEDFQFDPPAAGSYTLNTIKTAPNGEVLDINGNKHDLLDITQGKISLVSFVYLNCGDINGCPLAMSTLFDIHDTSLKIPALRDEVQLLTISFDPQRDTVEAIEAFAYPITSDEAAAGKLDWQILTTAGQDQLRPILKGYGQVVDRSEDQEKISHLLRIFLVDREGNIRNIYGLGLIDPRLLMTDVETLMMEEGRL